ncbi:MAG: type 4a pilus biogenesis protein PilO [Candidatus Omnitrophica bacterium]|nr:type 4a pilus biogenesis protein PilO [Candidatus Omnitrophota bacterium]
MKKIDLLLFSNKQIKEAIIFLLIGLAIFIFDSSFVLKGQWANFLSVKENLKEVREKITATALDGFSTERLKGRLDQLSESVSDKKKGILKEEDVPNVLNEISRLADNVNLKIMRLTPLKEIRDRDRFTTSEDSEYYILPISIIARGAYHSLGKFLDSLEKVVFSIKIQAIDIIPKAAGLLNPEHDIKLTLSIFVVDKHEAQKP